MERKFDMPVGELVMFNSPYELKQFISMCIPQGIMHKFGAIYVPVEGSEYESYVDGFSISIGDGSIEAYDEVEYLVPVTKEYVKLPYFDPNMFYGHDGNIEPAHFTQQSYAKPEEIYLDPKEWGGVEFPVVGYIWIESSFDRTGDMEVSVVNFRSVSGIRDTVPRMIAYRDSETADKAIQAGEEWLGYERRVHGD